MRLEGCRIRAGGEEEYIQKTSYHDEQEGWEFSDSPSSQSEKT